MRIFLSFASPDRLIAERIQLALSGAGHKVFFDEASLAPGSDYNSRIRDSIRESQLFVFLISPSSVMGGRYVDTELKFAKIKWPKPWGFVLPVVIRPTDYSAIDPYLASVTVLEPRGNVAAEVAAAVDRHSRSGVLGRIIVGIVVALVLVVGGSAPWWWKELPQINSPTSPAPGPTVPELRLTNPEQLHVNIISLEGPSPTPSEKIRSALQSLQSALTKAGCTDIKRATEAKRSFPETGEVRFYYAADSQNAQFLNDYINNSLRIATKVKNSTDRVSGHGPGELHIYVR